VFGLLERQITVRRWRTGWKHLYLYLSNS